MHLDQGTDHLLCSVLKSSDLPIFLCHLCLIALASAFVRAKRGNFSGVPPIVRGYGGLGLDTPVARRESNNCSGSGTGSFGDRDRSLLVASCAGSLASGAAGAARDTIPFRRLHAPRTRNVRLRCCESAAPGDGFEICLTNN